MIVLRGARESDLDSLLRFSQIPGMFNLPGDPDTLRDRIVKSVQSFNGKTRGLSDSKYTFIAEDLTTGQILATSMIAGQHGTPDSPHFYFQVSHEKRFSETIGTGFIHGTLTLGYDTDGPSEIGALVVDPDLRNHESRIGRQIAFVRFLYVAAHRERFRPQIMAELLPPLNKRGLSPLWEAIGRRFTSMDYWEADQLCAKNKDFIFDLFPTGKIYTTFLPAEARNAIGKVGKDTEPVFHMLKKLGFEYRNQIDPFDGGPHLWAEINKISPILKTRSFKWSPTLVDDSDDLGVAGLLAKEIPPSTQNTEFRAVGVLARTKDGALGLKKGPSVDLQLLEKTLSIGPGDSVLFMPYY